MKLKTYQLRWRAEVSGIQTVQAFDEKDAEEQFHGLVHIEDLDDSPMYAELEDIIEVPEVKTKKKVKK
jgi:hypothetical protein